MKLNIIFAVLGTLQPPKDPLRKGWGTSCVHVEDVLFVPALTMSNLFWFGLSLLLAGATEGIV